MLYQLENVLEVDNGRKGSTKAVQHTEGTNRKEPSGLISNQWRKSRLRRELLRAAARRGVFACPCVECFTASITGLLSAKCVIAQPVGSQLHSSKSMYGPTPVYYPQVRCTSR